MSQSPQLAIMDFFQRFNDLQLRRQTSDDLIKDLLFYSEHTESVLRQENARLNKELVDAQLDLDDARKSRRELQQKMQLAELRIGQVSIDYDTIRNRNPYILVLIDGDGMIFNEDLVRQGVEGGKQAANNLRNLVLGNCSDLKDQIEVVAKICANVNGLATVMQRGGVIEDPNHMRDFTLGFTQGKASFDYVDVGYGKERADSKLKESLRWHLKNYNCKHVLLGISHDAGYAPFLDEVVTQDDRSRITILEGIPTVRELVATGLPIINSGDMFRSEKLIDRVPATAPHTWAGVAVTPTRPPPALISPPASRNGGVPIKKPSTASTWVPEPRGLDSPITINVDVLDKVKRRPKDNKLCNNHYLRGPCAKKNDGCMFEHQYKPTPEELAAISYLARLNPCANLQDCESESCIYGHHCPSTTTGANGFSVCKGYFCKFSDDDHPPGTTFKNSRKERDYERY